jgi:hypothetical protein
MNVEIETEAAQFPEKEYISGILLAVRAVQKCSNVGLAVIPDQLRKIQILFCEEELHPVCIVA